MQIAYGRTGYGSEDTTGDYGTSKSGTYHEGLQSEYLRLSNFYTDSLKTSKKI